MHACGRRRDRGGMTARRLLRRNDSAAPPLLPMFLAAMLVMVGAVVVVGRTGSDWADVGAVALLFATLGLLVAAILRRLRDDDPPS
jgi:hypothetical protein